MENLRKIDFGLFKKAPGRMVQPLLDRASGATTCNVVCQKVAPGGVSTTGRHIHDFFDQITYVVSGTLMFEIDGRESQAAAGTLVVVPMGIPHRHWNPTKEDTITLVISAPLLKEGMQGHRSL